MIFSHQNSSFHVSGVARSILFAVLNFCLLQPALANAQEVLFIGNSYTAGDGLPELQKFGAVPKLVELIATSKGKSLSTGKVIAGGKDLGYHLQQAETLAQLSAKKWNYVVLQDLSTKPTAVINKATQKPNVEEFFENGVLFYNKIREVNPDTKVVLYQTWARGKDGKFFAGYKGPDEMFAAIIANYAEQARRLEELEPGDQILLAPVGAAFQMSLAKYPEINLYNPDNHHATVSGLYLSALVIYATITKDTPAGATNVFGSVTIPEEVAQQLQDIAVEITAPQRIGK